MKKKYSRKYFKLEKTWWWFSARRELLDQILKKINKREMKILDFGCSSGINMNILGKYGNVFGIDKDKEAIKIAKMRGFNVLRGDIKTKFKDKTFDLITCLDVIEHIDKDRDLLKEFYRVLKKEGKLIITTSAFMFLWSTHDIINQHKRRYEKNELEEKIRYAGFKILKSSYWNMTSFLPVLLFKSIWKGIKSSESYLIEAPKILNYLMLNILRIENNIISKANLPIGVSLLLVCGK